MTRPVSRRSPNVQAERPAAPEAAALAEAEATPPEQRAAAPLHWTWRVALWVWCLGVAALCLYELVMILVPGLRR
jgi:hypothetical protein